MEEYRNLIIGSGEAGKYLAWTLAAQGQKTAVVERRYIAKVASLRHRGSARPRFSHASEPW